GKKSAQIREILISESAWEEMTCLFAPSLNKNITLGGPGGYFLMNADIFISRLNKDLEGIVKIDKYGFFLRLFTAIPCGMTVILTLKSDAYYAASASINMP
ncbi:hypothetical protein ACUNIA_05815, partial [Serratia sp. IR-2025]